MLVLERMRERVALVVLAGCIGLVPAGVVFGAERPAEEGPRLPVRPYVLVPNDLVQLKVYQEDDLSVSVRVAPNGTATFPLIETVKIGGLTVEEAARVIREALARDYLVDPKVTLTVLEQAERTFSIIGFVQKPGAYAIVGAESVSLVQAIAMAGGGAPEAKLSKVTVMRPVAGQPNQIFVLDALKMIRDPNAAAFQVLPGDTVQVPDKIF